MLNEGWTLGDLDGELMVRGIDINDLSPAEIDRVCSFSRPEHAAEDIERSRR